MYDGEIIKKLRLKKGLNQADLAALIGCSQRNISSYETTRTRPDIDQLSKLADVFNVSTDYLLGRSDESLETLNENENYIIQTYRNLRAETKIEFMSMVNMIKTLRDIQKRNLG